jgi:hypothetical protein
MGGLTSAVGWGLIGGVPGMPYQKGRVFRRTIVAAVVAAVMALAAVPASAGSSHVTFSFLALPPALTLSDSATDRFGLLEGILKTQSTTATHVLLTVTVTTGEAITVVSSGCTTTTSDLTKQPITTTIRCSAPNVNPNSTETIPIEFKSPSSRQTCAAFSTPCITFNATLTFAEGNANQGGDTNGGSSSILLFTTADRATADGNCVTENTNTLGTQAGSTANQGTQVSFGLAANLAPGVALPCTPGAAGVQRITLPANSPLHSDQVSFVSLPKLANSGLATGSVTIFNLPSGVNANNFVLQEFVNDIFGPAFDATAFFPVPACVNGQIPSNPPGPSAFPGVTFNACKSGQDSYGHGGVIVSLIMLPSGDPDFDG